MIKIFHCLHSQIPLMRTVPHMAQIENATYRKNGKRYDTFNYTLHKYLPSVITWIFLKTLSYQQAFHRGLSNFTIWKKIHYHEFQQNN
jgi:hypothetical protein